jgi:acetyl-CoA C-acetyltransferase
MAGDIDVAVSGGAESISHTRNAHTPTHRAQPQCVLDAKPYAYMAMIETAEFVAERYGISRADQDAVSALSHQRAAAATAEGRFAAEIVPITVRKNVIEKDGSISATEEVTLRRRRGHPCRYDRGVARRLKPVWKDGLLVKEASS